MPPGSELQEEGEREREFCLASNIPRALSGCLRVNFIFCYLILFYILFIQTTYSVNNMLHNQLYTTNFGFKMFDFTP